MCVIDDFPTGTLPLNKIIHGDSLSVLKKIPDNSIDCVITSPPYWGKRDYGEETVKIWGENSNCDHKWDKQNFCVVCGAWRGQLGLEPTPELFVKHLIEIFREIKRVLKPHGNVFVVIDDSYSGSGGWNSGGGLSHKENEWERSWVKKATTSCPSMYLKHVPKKSLCLVPELFAIRMVYELGFVLRNKIVWAKKVHVYKDKTTIGNAMPESVKDRLCHTWEYIYHFTKRPKYWYNLDAVRVPLKEETVGRMRRAMNLIKRKGVPITPNNKYWEVFQEGNIQKYGHAGILTGRFYDSEQDISNIVFRGANPGDVLQINPEPFSEAHFAVYPTKLVEFLIKVGCPEKVCKNCGMPADWRNCSCGAGYKRGVVLDPFLGAGTTAFVALKMGRDFVGIEINREYCGIAMNRIKDLVKQGKLPVELVL